ncbi:rhodanese-like domain-containing protein [Rhodoferax ferrireducens]|uniref:rhodanese-like domain-containing protein n=1 Tax=Rhodoferax ferrireducens TaxID=192843 RepID=UPI003BB6E191
MKPTLGKSLLASALLALAAAASAGLPAVNVKQAAALQGSGALLLDVREADEYVQGHAPGSTLIPLGQLAQRLKEISPFKNQRVVLICRSGRRSAQATALLETAGFSAASNIEGGMLAWQQAGLPVLTGAASR